MPSLIQHQVGKHPARALGNLEDGLPDARVLKHKQTLVVHFGLPEETEFLTYVQPVGAGTRNGVWVPNIRALVFMVASPNPNPRYKEKYIKTHLAVDLEQWERNERNRAISDLDPAFSIFESLCSKHAQAIREWGELQ